MLLISLYSRPWTDFLDDKNLDVPISQITILQEKESHPLPPATVRLNQKSSSVYTPPHALVQSAQLAKMPDLPPLVKHWHISKIIFSKESNVVCIYLRCGLYIKCSPVSTFLDTSLCTLQYSGMELLTLLMYWYI